MINNFNIAFSAIVFMASLFFVSNSFLENEKNHSGRVKAVYCAEDSRHKGTFSYEIELNNDKKFGNRLDIPCELFLTLKKDDYIKLISRGNRLININFNGRLIFDQKLVETRGSKIIAIFFFLMVISAGDLGYRLYKKFFKQGVSVK
ncbi:MAG: hypothetical protein ACI9O6_002939 [Glaciecola sp.]|jgi:hypothetical protein